MYTELFKMCGYSDEEIDKERPRIEKMLERIGVTTVDQLKHAEENTKINFELELAGVRKFLRYFMKGFIDSVLAKEENEFVIYYNLPNPKFISLPVVKAAQEANRRIFIGNATDWSWQVMGSVFDKTSDLLEKAELLGQPAGKAHCAHYQIHVALLEQGIIPKPDLLWSSGIYCDQAPEADELAATLIGCPTISLDGLNDWGLNSWPNDLEEHGVKYIAARVRQAYEKIKELTGLEVNETHIEMALQTVGKVAFGWQNLVDMVAKGDPQPVRFSAITLAHFAEAFTIWYEKDLVDAYNTMLRDVHKRIKAGKGVVTKGAPKVYVQLRTTTDMRPLKMIEDLGLRICMCFFDKFLPETLAESRFTDLYDVISEAFFKIPIFCGVGPAIHYWKEICKLADVDGMILTYEYSCRPYAQQPILGKKVITEDLNIPVIVVECATWDQRNYSAEQIRTRIESFAEMLKMRKTAEAARRGGSQGSMRHDKRRYAL